MEDLITRPPRSIMEVYKMLPEGTLAELIEGNIYMSPAPSTNHQRVITLLISRFVSFLENKNIGSVYVSPIDVFLDEDSNAVQPDIVFVSSGNVSIIRHDAIHGVPDLLIEILSPGNKNHDLIKKKELYVKKKELYEKFGVKEYWIIDPETKEALGYSLQKNQYVEFFKSIGSIQSALLNASFKF